MPQVLTRRGAVLPFELKSIMGDGSNRVQHAVMECCDCPAHTASFPWVHPINPKLICEKFERMGWEVYKNKARCPDCKKARNRQKHHFAGVDRLLKLEEKMKTSQQPISIAPLVKTNPITPVVHTINTNGHQAQTPKPPPPRPQPERLEVPPREYVQPVVEVVRTYLMTVNSDGTVDLRDLDEAKEMLFGD